MNYIDLLLLGVVLWHIYRAISAGWRRTVFAMCRDAVALAVAMLLQPRVAEEVSKWPWVGLVADSFSVHMALPAGAGLTIGGLRQWLQEGSLPRFIAQAIIGVWERDSVHTVATLLHSASFIVAEALVNLICLLALFVGMRWLLCTACQAVTWALPERTGRESMAMVVVLGIIQSVLVGMLVTAVLAPLINTTLLPRDLVEYFSGSRLLPFFGFFLRYINFYGAL
ncbi:MAG: hypothetical protein DDT36_01710 [Firmicutes bacterium]|nr:hypothetical protein [Bacillota bacterium]